MRRLIVLCGLDSGSRSVKLTVMSDEKKIIFNKVFDTVNFYREYGHKTPEGLVVDI